MTRLTKLLLALFGCAGVSTLLIAHRAQRQPVPAAAPPVSGRLADAAVREWARGAEGAPRFRMQLMSDLHLEFPGAEGQLPAFEARAPVLALAGDVGSPRGAANGTASAYERFLHAQSERFEHVLVVSGNHELYMGVHEAAVAEIRAICERAPRGNVHYLARGTWECPRTGVRVVGASLWSHVPERHAAYVQEAMNDYKYIFAAPSDAQAAAAVAARPELAGVPREALVMPVTVRTTNAWHAADLVYVRAELARAAADGAEAVVLTHHAPIMWGTATPLEESDPLAHALATDLSADLGGAARAWCFGHTHVSSDQIVNGTRVVSNQVGYMMWGEHLPPSMRTAEQARAMEAAQPGYDEPDQQYSFEHAHAPEWLRAGGRPQRVFYNPEFVLEFGLRKT